MAKQETGQRYGVKSSRAIISILVGSVVLSLLGACAGPKWQNPHKSAAEAEADEQTCNARAEDAALLRARRQRADYNPTDLARPSGMLSRGESPMQLADRGQATKDFSRQFKDCMESKGYTLGDSKNKP